jgi:peroxiredoxin Q/BCP
MLEAPAPYPSFRLTGDEGQVVDSADLAGAWFLVYWYPKADTPGCTAQAIGLRDQIDGFDDVPCRVLGVSYDPPDVNRAFAARHGLPFSLLTDADRRLAAAVGAAPDDRAHPVRVAHLVDPTGTIRVAYDVTDPEFFAERVLDDLAAAGAIAADGDASS